MTINKPTEEAIINASALLNDGELVAFPTETVYGIGADATNDMAVAKVFAAKGRPAFNPLIIHIADIKFAEDFAHLCDNARKLANAFWPGPLTIIIAKKPGPQISELATAGLDTIAIRCPDHPVALKLLKHIDRPIVAPSANRSGHISATEAAHVEEDLGEKIAIILDGGATAIGIESTVISLTPDPKILRPGAISAEEIEKVIGPLAKANPRPISTVGKITSPGQLASHYAPNAQLRLNATKPEPGEALLAFGAPLHGHIGPMINLSPQANLMEAAANLFASLRSLDKSGCSTIAVMPIPDEGLGEAINDRLKRAAAPRET